MHLKLEEIYFNALKLSRSEKIYNIFGVKDVILNKIYILFIHLSIYFNNNFFFSKKEEQVFFDYIFKRIESDLREVGIGDMALNKKMKILVSKFYSILVDFKNFNKLSLFDKNILLKKYLDFEVENHYLADYLSGYFLKKIKT